MFGRARATPFLCGLPRESASQRAPRYRRGPRGGGAISASNLSQDRTGWSPSPASNRRRDAASAR